MLEAVKVALDPAPAQERRLISHAGAARFAFNAGLAHVKEMLEAKEKPAWSLYALRRWWNANKETLAVDASGAPWWRENSKESYNSGLEALSDALSNWSNSRKGRRRGAQGRVPAVQSQRQDDAAVRVYDRLVRPHRRRPTCVETAAHRTSALHGEHRGTGRGREGAAHDRQPACGPMVRVPDRGTAGRETHPAAKRRGGRHRSGRQDSGDTLGRHRHP